MDELETDDDFVAVYVLAFDFVPVLVSDIVSDAVLLADDEIVIVTDDVIVFEGVNDEVEA